MVARNRQYTDSEVRYAADHTDCNKSGTTDINTGFIILPPWVADKIELAGGDLVDFFFRCGYRRHQRRTPSAEHDWVVSHSQYERSTAQHGQTIIRWGWH